MLGLDYQGCCQIRAVEMKILNYEPGVNKTERQKTHLEKKSMVSYSESCWIHRTNIVYVSLLTLNRNLDKSHFTRIIASNVLKQRRIEARKTLLLGAGGAPIKAAQLTSAHTLTWLEPTEVVSQTEMSVQLLAFLLLTVLQCVAVQIYAIVFGLLLSTGSLRLSFYQRFVHFFKSIICYNFWRTLSFVS